ncbi:MAG: hypothetical protein A2X35_07470 [Elusimicrobia bacterium GWA2_61_42]|nr:MAG: hypothetical protein A2X35_07470 [Elusimicrobia bacterium GWA2_61_42]OGR75052.1 MAG: hypothetical protein A2X38_01620 [Elusimicrobia bacterium GWC2_61_25]
MLKQLVKTIGILLLAAWPACAVTIMEREISCPVCGQAFYTRLDVVETQSDMRLDLKPVGVTSAPWRLPDCPKCGFVIYKISFPKAELARCRDITASEEYQKGLKRAAYFRAGLLYAKLGKPAFSTANIFLKASWQEESDAAALKEDLELSLKYFTARAADETDKTEEWENSKLLIGELLRRLGRFEEARAHLTGLKTLKGFQNNFFAEIVEYELKLCAKADFAPHTMEDVRDSKKPLLARAWIQTKKFFARLPALFSKRSE